MELPTEAWSAHTRRLKDERAARWLSPGHLDALQALAALVAQGNPTPSVREIADLADVSARTVQRAIRRGKDRGLTAVEPRFDIVAGQSRQQENRYELLTPSEPVRPKPRPPRQTGVPSQASKIREGLRDGLWITGIARITPPGDLLAARRAVIQEKMLR